MRRLTAALLITTALGAVAQAQTTPAAPPLAPAVTPATPATPPATPAMAMAAPAGTDEQMAADARARTEEGDRAAMFEAHLAALHAGLTLDSDQEKLWPPVEKAIRGYAKMRTEMRDRRMDAAQSRDDQQPDENPIAALKSYSDGQLERAQALKALAEAAEPLYAALKDGQKHRIPMLLKDMTPQHGPIAMMIDRLGGETNEGTRAEDGMDRHRGRGWHEGEERRGERDWGDREWGDEGHGPGWGHWRHDEGGRRLGGDEDRDHGRDQGDERGEGRPRDGSPMRNGGDSQLF